MKKDLLRPKTLAHYIGQEQIKDQLKVAIQAAQRRNEPLDHILLNGPPGLGKTTLANIIASEMGWKIKAVIGPSLGSVEVAARLVQTIRPKTMIFIDEVHRLRKPVQELLYPVLEDNRLQSIYNSQVELPVPPLTIIGATTNIGRLERPFIDRFPFQFQLEYYETAELAIIADISAKKLDLWMKEDAIWEVVKRARSTPRIANNILKRLRDYAEVYEVRPVDALFASNIISTKLHIDDLGLRPLDHRYLKILWGADKGLGVEAIATKLHEEVETIEDYVEPYLLRLGFLERRRNGRWLTDGGRSFMASQLTTHSRFSRARTSSR